MPVSPDVSEGLQKDGVSVRTPVLHIAGSLGTVLPMPVALCVATNPPETVVRPVDGCKATAAKPSVELGLSFCS